MGRFIVVLAAKTFISTIPKGGGRLIFDDDTVVFFREMSDPRDYNLSGLSYGWLFEVKLNEENIEKAMVKARNISENLLNFLCLETGHPVYESKILLSYEITENIEKRIWRQYLPPITSIEGFDIELQEFINQGYKIMKYDNQRVFRAIRWFRKGVTSTDPLDQFLAFWHGLESLNPLLAENFKIKDKNGKQINTKVKKIGKKCEYCGKGCTTVVPAGIEALYDNLNIDETLRKKIAETRIGLVHGTKTIKELNQNSVKLLPKISTILFSGLSAILKIPFKKSSYQNLETLTPTNLGEINYLQGFLMINDLSKIKSGYYPFLSIEEEEEDGKITIITHTYCDIKQVEFGTFGNVNLDNIKIKPTPKKSSNDNS